MATIDKRARVGVVPAAGFGIRFRPFTERVPKPALPLLNRPILHWAFDSLRAAGVDRVLVNLHHRPEKVREAAAAYGESLRAEFFEEPAILGTAGLFFPMLDRIGGDVFLVFNGDVHFGGDLSPLVTDLQMHPGALACLGVRPLPPGGSYTRLEVCPNGTLQEFGRGPWMFTGLYAARRALLDPIRGPGFRELVKDLLAPRLSGRLVRAIPLDGTWGDLGSPRSFLLHSFSVLGRLAREGGPALPPGCRLEVRCGFPLLIHQTAEVPWAFEPEGPLIIGPGSRIAPDARAGWCVLLPGAAIDSGESLLGVILDGEDRVVVEYSDQVIEGF